VLRHARAARLLYYYDDIKKAVPLPLRRRSAV
jgi:hypothetical protein